MNQIVLAGTVFLLGSLGVRGTNVAEEELQLALAKANNEFGWRMYKELKNTEEKLIFSPLSLSSLLMSLLSQTSGTTKEEIVQALALPRQYNDTALYDGFLDLVNGLKHGGENMNLTIKNYTIVGDVGVLLINDVSFNGQWLSKFDPHETRSELFHGSPGSSMAPQMMYQQNSFSYINDNDYQAIKLDYQGDMSMVILLPRNVDGIHQLEDTLPYFDWDDFDKRLESQSTIINVTLPKFFLEVVYSELKTTLQKLGIRALFEGGDDPPRMLGSSNVYAAYVIQTSSLNVTEEGTEALTRTLTAVGEKSSHVKTRRVGEFVADHPFIFILRHEKSKTNILVGRVAELKKDRGIPDAGYKQ